MSVTVEDDVPIPPPGYRSGRPRTEAAKKASTMKVGQCATCETENEFAIMRTTIRKLGGRYTTRKLGDKWRIWRIG